MADQELLTLIERIYDTVIDGANWTETLDHVAHSVGARGIILFDLLQDENRREFLIPAYATSNYERANIIQYLRQFEGYEIEDQIEFAKRSDKDARIELVGVNEFYDEYELLQRPNAEFMRQAGIFDRAGAILNKDSWSIDRFSIQFPCKISELDPDKINNAKHLLPHLSKALRLTRPILQKSDNNYLLKQVEQSDLGILILSPENTPIFQNQSLRAIQDEHGIFRAARDGTLHPVDSALKSQIAYLRTDIALHGESGAKPRKQAISVSANNASENAIFVEICPITMHPELGQFPEGTLLISCLDINKSNSNNAACLARFYPLSKSELSICELVLEGYSNSEIAEIRQRSLETINSQVKSRFRKTYTNNRVELSQLTFALGRSFDDG